MTAWTPAKYPGDSVRQQLLIRGDECGDIRIQEIRADCWRVASFLPGFTIELPGDTPKMNPELDAWYYVSFRANECFDLYLAQALADGWQIYDRNKSA